MAELFLQKLKDPNLPKGLGSAVRDAFGLDSVSTVNTCFAVIFGGLETGGSVIANLIRLLAANPTCLAKVGTQSDVNSGGWITVNRRQLITTVNVVLCDRIALHSLTQEQQAYTLQK